MTNSVPSPATKAKAQLGRVLWILAALDAGVLTLVAAVVELRARLGLTNLGVFLVILVGVGAVLATRIWLGIRLRARGGDL